MKPKCTALSNHLGRSDESSPENYERSRLGHALRPFKRIWRSKSGKFLESPSQSIATSQRTSERVVSSRPSSVTAVEGHAPMSVDPGAPDTSLNVGLSELTNVPGLAKSTIDQIQAPSALSTVAVVGEPVAVVHCSPLVAVDGHTTTVRTPTPPSDRISQIPILIVTTHDPEDVSILDHQFSSDFTTNYDENIVTRIELFKFSSLITATEFHNTSDPATRVHMTCSNLFTARHDLVKLLQLWNHTLPDPLERLGETHTKDLIEKLRCGLYLCQCWTARVDSLRNHAIRAVDKKFWRYFDMQLKDIAECSLEELSKQLESILKQYLGEEQQESVGITQAPLDDLTASERAEYNRINKAMTKRPIRRTPIPEAWQENVEYQRLKGMMSRSCSGRSPIPLKWKGKGRQREESVDSRSISVSANVSTPARTRTHVRVDSAAQGTAVNPSRRPNIHIGEPIGKASVAVHPLTPLPSPTYNPSILPEHTTVTARRYQSRSLMTSKSTATLPRSWSPVGERRRKGQ
jgi:hypothetical protein